MLTFWNPTTLDLRLITTFGASVKTDDASIGYFGTGLKYAIAGVLRMGGNISLTTPEGTFQFSEKSETIRGKTIPCVYMEAEDRTLTPCGFTTELGRNWTPWMIYREFWANMRDEHGSMNPPRDWQQADEYTCIKIYCRELAEIHREQDKYVLSSKPLETIGELEIHQGHSDFIFFRGMQAGKLSRPSRFTYNLNVHPEHLSEDRTLNDYAALNTLSYELVRSDNRTLLTTIALLDNRWFEYGLYSRTINCSETFKELGSLRKTHRGKIIPAWNAAFKRLFNEKDTPEPMELNERQKVWLNVAADWCAGQGYKADFTKITVTRGLADRLLGCVEDGQIYISHKAFEGGLRLLATTLLEELIHQIDQVSDGRPLQDKLLNLLVDASGANF